MSSLLLTVIQNFVTWLLNPATMLDGSSKVVAYLLRFVANHMLTGQASDTFNNAASFFQGQPFANGLGLVAYICSPFISPAVLLGCCGVMMDAWLIYLLIAVAFTIKGWFTGQGA